MLGTPLPQKPEVMDTGLRPPPPMTAAVRGKCHGRPGEPINKVYVQFSNDLEGFLPYTLVISEDAGLEFKSLVATPDFQIDPLNVLKAMRIEYERLIEDAFFQSLASSITSRPDLQDTRGERGAVEHPLAERARPPYTPMVQLSVRRTIYEGGQVLVFIAVQSELLASELVRSCEQLRRRRAILRATADGQWMFDDAGSRCTSGAASRGCPSPRAVASSGAVAYSAGGSHASSTRTGGEAAEGVARST